MAIARIHCSYGSLWLPLPCTLAYPKGSGAHHGITNERTKKNTSLIPFRRGRKGGRGEDLQSFLNLSPQRFDLRTPPLPFVRKEIPDLEAIRAPPRFSPQLTPQNLLLALQFVGSSRNGASASRSHTYGHRQNVALGWLFGCWRHRPVSQCLVFNGM